MWSGGNSGSATGQEKTPHLQHGWKALMQCSHTWVSALAHANMSMAQFIFV